VTIARRIGTILAFLALGSAVSAHRQGTQTTPTKPLFPGSVQPAPAGTPPPSAQPATPTRPSGAPAPLKNDAPAEVRALAYPSADYLGAIDAGRGQRYYLFGTNTPYPDILMYYKNVLKNSGRELFKTPAMQQFDLGKYSEDTMAYPPSVVVKDYTWNGSEGYLHVDGVMEKRFRTVIQIVPSSGK